MQRQDGCSKSLMNVRLRLSWIDHRPNYWSVITVKVFQGLEAESCYHGLLCNPNTWQKVPIRRVRFKACISHHSGAYI
jgi:hypothetical protein